MDLQVVVVVLVNLDPFSVLVQPHRGHPILVLQELQMLMAAAVLGFVVRGVGFQVAQDFNFLQTSKILR